MECFMKNLWETGQKNNGDTTLNWKASQYAQLLWGCFLSSSQITAPLKYACTWLIILEVRSCVIS